MRNSYEVRAQKFIRQVASYIADCHDYCDLDYAMMNYMIDHPSRKVSVNHGMARMVLITSDYVIKMDSNPDWIEEVGGGEEEMKFYSIAENEGMAYLFAKVSRYDYNGRSYYIMPRVYGIDPDRWFDAYHYMTQEERNWCMEHQLYDLHCNNYGFRDGHVCIVDYACSEEILSH